jgi:hypothetical protein
MIATTQTREVRAQSAYPMIAVAAKGGKNTEKIVAPIKYLRASRFLHRLAQRQAHLIINGQMIAPITIGNHTVSKVENTMSHSIFTKVTYNR